MLQIRVGMTVLVLLTLARVAVAEESKVVPISKWDEAADEWFQSDEGGKVISNVLTWQNANGGWYKTYNTLEPRPKDYMPATHPLAPKDDGGSTWAKASTIDNGATFSELRLLARAVHLTKREDALAGFNRGIAFLFESQYPNGGWPQRFPLQDNYGRHITFNDDAMVNVLELLRDASKGEAPFDFVPEDMRKKCRESFDRGIECILNCQIKQEGQLTVWCQQHDEQTLAPANGRTFEPASFSSTESAAIVSLLMKIEQPSDRVKAAVDGAVAWFDHNKMVGKRYEKVRVGSSIERRLVDDPAAPPYWARMYELGTTRPIFVDRGGKVYYEVNELSVERRSGYAWFSTRPNGVLKEYAKWQARVGK